MTNAAPAGSGARGDDDRQVTTRIAAPAHPEHGCAPGHAGCAGHPPLTFRPCRTRGCAGRRPIVPIGSSSYWDRCPRCAGRRIRATPYPVPDDRPPFDPWAERVAEVLTAAEGRWAA
jgi:hypothetical protein